eukprot:6693727-Lingulodinium_polyedra.AAC.1
MGLRVALLMVGEARPSLKPQVAEGLRSVMLLSAAQLADLVLGPGETVYVDAGDVRFFFYMLRWPRAR